VSKSIRIIMGGILAVLAGALAPAAQAGEHGACSVLDSPFTLAEIVEAAVALEPGTPLKAGFSVQPTGTGEPETLFKVKLRKEDGGKALLFFDTDTAQQVIPVTPELSLLEAYDLAVAAVEAAAGEEGAVVLRGHLRPRVFVPNWRFAIVDPAAKLALARVDAVTSQVTLLTPKQVARAHVKHKLHKKRRIYRHVSGKPFRCDALDEDDEPEDEDLIGGE
jgi:hypothetical protein